jgi:type III pantothenate kinase
VSFEKEVNVHFISHKDPFPFTNCYATPQTLGIDRLVLASGASLQFPNQNRLVIDVGTCVTYDFIDENNNYLGGAISPGLRLRYEALHRFTAKLPLLSIDSSEQFIGKSTSESIHSGVINGLVYEIDGFIEEYRKRFTDVVVVLTGGDTELLSTRLKNDSFVNANFLLESLNYVFLYMMNHGLKK